MITPSSCPEDAVTLEKELHRHFAESALNRANARKEFFLASPVKVREVLLEKVGNMLEWPPRSERNADGLCPVRRSFYGLLMGSGSFRIAVDDEILNDLTERLKRAPFTHPTGAGGWAAGVDPDYLSELVRYWAEEFDWRAQEERLNGFDHHLVDIDDARMHYVTIAGEPAAGRRVPILLLHGWPSAFTEMLELGERLAHPSRFGARSDVVFDVVIPSFPGFLFSDAPEQPLTTPLVAERMHTLMTTVLGHQRYGAFAGDIGGGVIGRLATGHPDAVIGLHQVDPPWPTSHDDLSAEEQQFLADNEANEERDNGYSAIMSTRPDTIAAALVDSPTGLLAWIIDKYRAWSDCGGELESRFDRDYLLTVATLYWATNSIGASFRSYFDPPTPIPRATIEVPMAITLTQEPGIVGFPRTLAERSAKDIRIWDDPGTGGHFIAHEEPDHTATTTREFFRTLT